MNEGYLYPYLSDATINDTLCCCYYSVELNLTQVRGPLNIHACGVCKKAVKNMGQRALACDDCDKWCHKSCLEMNTIEFDELANNSLPWYCPSCNSLNRTTVVYDLPTVDYCTHIVNSTSIQPQTPAKSDGNLTHSSTGSSGIIDSSISLSSIEQQSSILATNISNSEHDDS